MAAGRAKSPEVPGVTDLRLIGRGGFGSVYRGRQVEFDRDVAVKVLGTATASDDASSRRFSRERRAIGAVSDHPNIVAVYAAGETDDGAPYIVMELMSGGSLADYLEREGPMAAELVLDVGIRLATALAVAHSAGVLHRDIKPANVLLSAYGEPCLGDFGIAQVDDATTTTSSVITATMAHAAPEILGGEQPSARTDVYSLASTLFTLLHGTPPFSDPDTPTLPAMIARIVTEPPPDLRSAGVPAEVATALEQALAKDPAVRPESARALGERLQAAQMALGLPVTAMRFGQDRAADTSPSPSGEQTAVTLRRDRTPTPRLSDRRRRAPGPLVAAVLAVVAGGGAIAAAVVGGDIGGDAERSPAIAVPADAPEDAGEPDGPDVVTDGRDTPSVGTSGIASDTTPGREPPEATATTPLPTVAPPAVDDAVGVVADRVDAVGDAVTSSTAEPTTTVDADSSPAAVATATPTAPTTTTSPTPTPTAAAPANQPPTAIVTITAGDFGTAPALVRMNATGSSDSDGSIADYHWDFGDGGTRGGAGDWNVTHTYQQPGTYTVRLTVTDDDGGVDTATADVTILENTPPTAVLVLTGSNNKYTPYTAGGWCNQSNDDDGSITSQVLDWGDGSVAACNLRADHVYETPGTYTITLTATDNHGATDTDTAVLTITEPPT